MAARRHVGGSGCPLLLAVETSCGTTSVALLRGEEVLSEEQAEAGRSGAESLLPCVDTVLRRTGLGLKAVEAFAISIGPGSFTGLRVGVATLKGLVFGTELPIAPVPTLAALAHAAPGARDPVVAHAAPGARDPVVALVDARRGEFYAAAYRLEGAEREPVPCEPAEGVYTPEQLAPRLPPACLLLGEGVALCGERIRALARSDVRLGPAAEPHARDVGILGARRIARGEVVSAAGLVPRYVRRAEAEVKRTGRRFE